MKYVSLLFFISQCAPKFERFCICTLRHLRNKWIKVEPVVQQAAVNKLTQTFLGMGSFRTLCSQPDKVYFNGTHSMINRSII